MAREHEQPGRDQLVSLPGNAGKLPAGDNPGAFRADVVASLCHLPEMINQGL
jgi:hypothetical protein